MRFAAPSTQWTPDSAGNGSKADFRLWLPYKAGLP